MKIRQGFVSNSSTTSFMIYGTEINLNNFIDSLDNKKDFITQAIEHVKTIRNNSAETTNNYVYNHITDFGNTILERIDTYEYEGEDKLDALVEDISEFIDYYIDILGLDGYQEPYSEYLYFGQSLKKLKDDNTFKEFKNETEKIINEAFPDVFGKSDFSILEGAWRDG